MENISAKKSTSDLIELLTSEHAVFWFKQHVPDWEHSAESANLKDYFNNYFHLHPEITVADVIRRSGLDRSYAYQIINGTKQHPGKYRLAILCLCMGMDLDGVQRALTIAGCSVLYPKLLADAALIVCIHEGYTSSEQILAFLQENGIWLPEYPAFHPES